MKKQKWITAPAKYNLSDVIKLYDTTRGMPPAAEKRLGKKLVQVTGVTRKSRVLEVGAGTGRISRPFAPYTGVYVASDISDLMIKQLEEKEKRNGRITSLITINADMRSLPFPNGQFDLGVCVLVLHQIDDKKKALKEFCRVIKKDGKIIIDINNGFWYDQIFSYFITLLEKEAGIRDGFTKTPVGLGTKYLDLFFEKEGFLPESEGVLVTWKRAFTPYQAISYIAEGQWKFTRHIPQTVLNPLLTKLQKWAIQTYGDLDKKLFEDARIQYKLYKHR